MSHVSCVAAAQQPETRPWVREVRDSVQSALRHTPGLWVVIVDRGQIVVSEALGKASMIGPTPLTRETLVRISGPGELSINLALRRLADMGRLDLDAPISRYVRVHPALGRVTAAQLIGHRAGFRAKHFTNPLWQDADLSRQVQSWDERVFIAEPGETRSHSHYSVALAGYLVESLVGKPFPDAMRELVWGPMGVVRGTTRIADVLTLPLAQGHRLNNGVFEVVRPLGEGFIGWPNALFLSLDGLDRFALALADPTTGAQAFEDSKVNARTNSWGWGGIDFTTIVDRERRFCALIVYNAYEGERSRLAEAIRHSALGETPPPPPAAIAWTPVSSRNRERLIGVYENENTLRIFVRDGKLVLQSGESVAEVEQGGDNLFRAPLAYTDSDPISLTTFRVEASRDGKARLLRIGSRVWTRKQPA
jgi:CubicO group peptidase (beta-lactamase class C family)